MARSIRVFVMVMLGLVMGFAQSVATAQEIQGDKEQLPGSSGPPVEFLNKNPLGIELLDVTFRVWGEPTLTGAPNVLPTDITGYCIVIRIKGLRSSVPEETEFALRLVNQDGSVNPEGFAMNQWREDRRTGESTLSLCTQAKGDKPYPDGPYKCTVTVGDVKAAVLNWSVGAN